MSIDTFHKDAGPRWAALVLPSRVQQAAHIKKGKKMLRSVRNSDLRKGMVLAYHFGKTGTIVEEPRIGRTFVHLTLAMGQQGWTGQPTLVTTRVGLYDESLIEDADYSY